MMKKTLTVIASLVLGSASSQAAYVDVEGYALFERVNSNWQDVIVHTSSVPGLVFSDRISSFESKSNSSLLDASDVPANYIIPDANVSDWGASNWDISQLDLGNYWKMGIEVTNTSGHDLLISSAEIAMIGATAGGYPLPGIFGVANNGYVSGVSGLYNKPVNMSLTLEKGVNSVLYTDTLAFNVATSPIDDVYEGSWDGWHTGTYDLGSSSVRLNTGESMMLYVEASSNADANSIGGFCAGLYRIRINGALVPEPATASLSLLGLAALMMRRRRA